MTHVEMTADAMRVEAETLRICSGFKVTPLQALNRIAQGQGWVDWAHCLRCKNMRNAK